MIFGCEECCCVCCVDVIEEKIVVWVIIVFIVLGVVVEFCFNYDKSCSYEENRL